MSPVPKHPRPPLRPAPERLFLTFGRNRIPISRDGVLVGRSPMCDVVLEDPKVSRTHARFAADSRGSFVEDLGSTAGVTVNGERITRRPLERGDVVLVGSTRFDVFGADSDAPRDVESEKRPIETVLDLAASDIHEVEED